MNHIEILGLIPDGGGVLPLLLAQGIKLGLPYAIQFAEDPTGVLSRIGDALVWHSATGQHVIGGLASVSASLPRIEQAINHIDTVQLGMSHTLGAMHVLSMANLGATCLTGAAIGSIMILQQQYLKRQFDKLSETLKDVDDKLDAQQTAHLHKAVQKVREFEDSEDSSALVAARDEGQTAANIYGLLTAKEASQKRPRIEVLNFRCRSYLLSLQAELQSRILLDQIPSAITRIVNEKPRLQSIAKSTFDAVIQDRPEYFLRAQTAKEGITLDLMTELYQQAAHADAITTPEIKSAGQLFEHCRAKGIAGSSWHSRGTSKSATTGLRYLMASLEEINQIEGLKLLISQNGLKNKASIDSFKTRLRDWWKEKVPTPADKAEPVAVYGFTAAI